MKILYYIFLFLALAYIFIIFTDGCQQQKRINMGYPRPEDTYLSVREFNDIMYVIMFGGLAMIVKIYMDKHNAKKRKIDSDIKSNEIDNSTT